MDGAKNSTTYLRLLSRTLIPSEVDDNAGGVGVRPLTPPDGLEGDALATLKPHEYGELWELANSHHVIMRAFPGLCEQLASQCNHRAEWFDRAIVKEQDRIRHATALLLPICQALEEGGDVLVIKSLDHWPDLGSDLDLYTNAEPRDVVAIMRERFKARLAARSWGDRLANKWNFVVPGMPELVEVHVARLGQTGEQIAITQSLLARARTAEFGLYTFRVPAPEDRMVISTLQRMYRHFYIRLCDIVDNARLVDGSAVDYVYLKSLAESAGLWNGLATYLTVISGYIKSYRGEDLPLPVLVTDSAKFGNELVRFKRNFLRIPLFPHSASLYASEWKRLLLNGEFQNTLRLSLLPGLATAAALELRLTGSDKGIW